jgi:hypothetical protein
MWSPPELSTGAGEFEEMRFAGARQVDNKLALDNAGIEYLKFPPVIVKSCSKSDS